MPGTDTYPWLVVRKKQVHIHRNSFGSLSLKAIYGECKNHRKTPKTKVNAISNQSWKLRLLCPVLSPCLHITKIKIHMLRNFRGSWHSESLFQIAVNVKIIENRQKANLTQFVIKFKNSIFDVLTVLLCPMINCNEEVQIHRRFITNCGECENHRKSATGKVNAICNKLPKLLLLMSKLLVLSPD